MCSRPPTIDGNTFACRTCDECISNRRHQWVCRAMMEKAQWSHTMCLALSYDDTTQANRDAAAMFQYADVGAWLKRLREAVRLKQPGARIRFLVAGEQGERNGRCHWHCIIYSDVDLTTLGQITGWKAGATGIQTLTDRRDIMSDGATKRRVNWSIWGHGFVTFQEPDQGGMHYVLSYVLKDQFTPEKSKGTMRETRVENFATGLFRMSKRPAIGEKWLYDKFARLDELGAVLPSLNITIPGVKGFYQPAGSFRQKTLWALVALNKRAEWLLGKPAPQWPSLLAFCEDNPTDLEVLLGPQKDPDNHQDEWIAIQREHAARAREAQRREFARTCGRSLPCDLCLPGLTDQALAALGLCRDFISEKPVFSSLDGKSLADRRHDEKGKPLKSNPYCERRGSKISRETFPDSD